jgi:DNA-binding transcriptional MerR regulator
VAASSGEGKANPDRHAAAQRAGEQGLLFGTEVSAPPDDLGYRGPTACAAAGITYRQLDYWARTELVEPSVQAAQGSGSQRLYSFRDIFVLKVVKRLLDTGVSLQQIRAAVSHLRHRGVQDLARITLMSDGVSVYECTSPDEVVDLVQGGQGVFGIALGSVWRELEGSLAELPAERARAVDDDEDADHPHDEQAARGRRGAAERVAREEHHGDGREADGAPEGPYGRVEADHEGDRQQYRAAEPGGQFAR